MRVHPSLLRKTLRSSFGALLLSIHLSSPANNIKNHAEELSRVQIFALGYVGFIGHISQEESLYRSVQGSKDALTVFTTIIRSNSSTTEAKAYAACGLRYFSRPLFDQETSYMRTYRNSEISVLRADILRKEKLTDLLDRIEKYGCN